MKSKNEFVRVFLATMVGIVLGLVLTMELLYISPWYSLLLGVVSGVIAYVAEDLRGFARSLVFGFVKAWQVVPMFGRLVKGIWHWIVNVDWKLFFWLNLAVNTIAVISTLFWAVLLYSIKGNLDYLLSVYGMHHVIFFILGKVIICLDYPLRNKIIKFLKQISKFHLVTWPYWIIRFVKNRSMTLAQANKKFLFWNNVAILSMGSWLVLVVVAILGAISFSNSFTFYTDITTDYLNVAYWVLGVSYVLAFLFSPMMEFSGRGSDASDAVKIRGAQKFALMVFPLKVLFYGGVKVVKLLVSGFALLGVALFLTWDNMHSENRLICGMDAMIFSMMAGLAGVTFDMWIASSVVLHVGVFALAGGIFGVVNLWFIKPWLSPKADFLRKHLAQRKLAGQEAS